MTRRKSTIKQTRRRHTGNCDDNACAESFIHTLKVELIQVERFEARKVMHETVFEYIEVDYNRVRRHSTIGQVSPEVFEAQQLAKQRVH